MTEVQPDPAWDYYVLWHEIQKTRHNFKVLIDFVAQQEEAVEEADDTILEQLNNLIDQLNNLIDQLTDIRDRR